MIYFLESKSTLMHTKRAQVLNLSLFSGVLTKSYQTEQR